MTDNQRETTGEDTPYEENIPYRIDFFPAGTTDFSGKPLESRVGGQGDPQPYDLETACETREMLTIGQHRVIVRDYALMEIQTEDIHWIFRVTPVEGE